MKSNLWRAFIVCVAAGIVFALSVANHTIGSQAPTSIRIIQVVAAENFYGNIIAQIGGRHVSVTSIMSNPTTDPHTYESNTRDASALANAALVVQNGLGYDDFIIRLENASPNESRTVIDVGQVFSRHRGDNPHQWYSPATMPRVASLVAAKLIELDPAHASDFRANLRRLDVSIAAYAHRLTNIRKRYGGIPIAVTEPVFGYAIAALGLRVLTPHSFQLAVQEGNDPSPQDVQTELGLLTNHKVKMFAYNPQAVTPVTARVLHVASANRIPIIGVYETMPGATSYQAWMLSELRAVDNAIGHQQSTERL